MAKLAHYQEWDYTFYVHGQANCLKISISVRRLQSFSPYLLEILGAFQKSVIQRVFLKHVMRTGLMRCSLKLDLNSYIGTLSGVGLYIFCIWPN